MISFRLSRYGLILAAGLAIRLALAPFFAHPFDMYSWYSNGEDLFTGKVPLWSFLTPYRYSFFVFVFPATYTFNFLTAHIGNTTIPVSALNPVLVPSVPSTITLVPGLLFDTLLKIPLIISDFLIAVLLFRIVSKHFGPNLGTTAAALWFLNPLTIWISSGWGQSDTLPTLLTLVSFYFLLEKKFTLSSVAIAGGAALKFYPAVLFIPLFIYTFRTKGTKGLLKVVASSIGLGILILLPNAGMALGMTASFANGINPQVLHYSGLSIWTPFTIFISNFNPTYLAYGAIAVSLSIVSILLLSRDARIDVPSVAISYSLALIPLLIFLPFVGENYLIWILPYLAMIAVARNYRTAIFWALSLVGLVSSLTDSLLPYYMLPLAPWIGNYLVSALHAVTPYRVASSGSIQSGFSLAKAFLSFLSLCSVFLLLSLWAWLRDG